MSQSSIKRKGCVEGFKTINEKEMNEWIERAMDNEPVLQSEDRLCPRVQKN